MTAIQTSAPTVSAGTASPALADYSDAYIPMSVWSKDHWTTLAYIESVMVDVGSFQVGADPRMKSNRRHYRVMLEECPRPKRANPSHAGLLVMRPEHSTRIKVAGLPQTVDNHDDWMCVQDMAHAGLFTVGPEGIEPGEELHFSDLGKQLSSRLRQHKMEGGQFAAFNPGDQTLQTSQTSQTAEQAVPA